MYFTGRKKPPCENMNRFNRLPEFEKELKRLTSKYRNLPDDLARLEKILVSHPTGIGTNFTITHQQQNTLVVKTRLACRALKNRSVRLIYAYHESTVTFVYLEIYFKGDK